MESIKEAVAIWTVAARRLIDSCRDSYERFFEHANPVSCDNGKLVIGGFDVITHAFAVDNFSGELRDALRDINGRDYDFELSMDYPELKVPLVPVSDTKRKEDIIKPPIVKPVIPPQSQYTFENFVVGEENRHAYLMAKAAATQPGLYNPLFIYGDSGIGKTHLLRSIEYDLLVNSPDVRVVCLSCRELIDRYYRILTERGDLYELRDSLRCCDVLLVDDIYLLDGKHRLQDEFFDIFNALYDEGKQIVLTSDKQPCDMQDIDKRLTTRFEQGVVTEALMPGYESRMAILMNKRREVMAEHPLSDELLEMLASRIQSSVRTLFGAFFRLTTTLSMSGRDSMSGGEGERILHSVLIKESRALSVADIQQAVASHFSVTLPEMLGKCRQTSVAEPRMMAMFLCRELTGKSTTEIGSLFGRDHATVINAEKRVKLLCDKKPMFRQSLEQLRRSLRRG
ncbi:MAG: chromosomal replication initiator protein DnaA [Victivallaceae bacterium]|nr:chromosomal replication initiator protein DnaA [Victivallaceae bacterium]